jgi:hypothetical protein
MHEERPCFDFFLSGLMTVELAQIFVRAAMPR